MGMKIIATTVDPKRSRNFIAIVLYHPKSEQLGFAGGAYAGVDVYFVFANRSDGGIILEKCTRLLPCARLAPVFSVLVVRAASTILGVPVGLQCAIFGCGIKREARM